MQVMMDKNELSHIRWGWFRGGIIFTLVTIVLVITVGIYFFTSTGQGQFTSNVELKLITPNVQPYNTTIPLPPQCSNLANSQPSKFEDVGVTFLAIYLSFLLVSMVVVAFVIIRKKLRAKEIARKPPGFWDWNLDKQA